MRDDRPSESELKHLTCIMTTLAVRKKEIFCFCAVILASDIIPVLQFQFKHSTYIQQSCPSLRTRPLLEVRCEKC